jgi:hypothetical protein
MSEIDEIDEYPVVRIFTFKEGLLSRFAHDLQLALTDFEVELADGSLRGTFRTDGVVVEGVIRNGKLDTRVLSSSDCMKIRKTIADEILLSDRIPDARLEVALSTDAEGVRLDGSLTLLGRRVAVPTIRPVDIGVAWTATILLTPSRWGIRPYRAMGGALKIQDRVRVEVALPVQEGFSYQDGRRRWAMKPTVTDPGRRS